MSEDGPGDAVEPDPTDPFDGLVLDDDFVRGAAVREAPAHVRARPAPRSPLPPRRNRRTRARTWVTSHPVPVVLVVALGAVVVAGRLGAGPLAELHHARAAGSAAATTTTAAKSTSTTVGGTTSTEDLLTRRSYSGGQCVTWDQQTDPSGESVTQVVPCTQPHLIEVASRAQAPETDAYPQTGPTPVQWVAIDEQVCGPLVERYLGVPVDPAGRFAAGAIVPSSISWPRGDREMWCGVEARPSDGQQLPNGDLLAFSGGAVGASQVRLPAPGTCLAATADGSGTSVVACTSPHISEVTGTVTVPAQVTSFPSSRQAWQDAVGTACGGLAVTYHGGALVPPLNSGWVEIAQSSWNLGQRTLDCAIGTNDASGQPVARTGSARAGAIPH